MNIGILHAHRSLIRAVVVAGFLLPAIFVAADMTVTPGLTIKNACNEDIIIAVHYKDIRGSWRTTSFISIPAGQQKNAVVSSNNSVFYFYAKSTTSNPITWEGDRNFNVDGKLYPMIEKTLDRDRELNRFYLRLRYE